MKSKPPFESVVPLMLPPLAIVMLTGIPAADPLDAVTTTVCGNAGPATSAFVRLCPLIVTAYVTGITSHHWISVLKMAGTGQTQTPLALSHCGKDTRPPVSQASATPCSGHCPAMNVYMLESMLPCQ